MKKFSTIFLILILITSIAIQSSASQYAESSFYYKGRDYNVDDSYGQRVEGNLHGKIIANNLNVREKTNIRGRVITQLNKGDEFYIWKVYHGNDGDWYYGPWHSEAAGWVFSKYVKLIRN